jgi:predicted Zn-dependent protease
MKKLLNFYSIIIFISLYILSCSTVPVTGRKQLNLIPAGQLLSMSYQQYDQFLKDHKLSSNKQQTDLVKRVGVNIKNAVEHYFREQGMIKELEGYQWEFNLVESKEVNAWCMPGGKVVFYEGIMPVCKDENGIAVVMGHEVAHAIAEHGNERMSQGLLAQLGGVALSEALKEKPQQTQQLWMAAYGLGAQVGILLPFSRTQESEADRLGLIFMAIAGYDPNGAVEFWQRMAQVGGQAPPEFLSTHPANQTRINDIKSHLPEAMGYYKKN